MLLKDAGTLDQYLVELVHRQGMVGSFEHADAASATQHLRACVEHYVGVARYLSRALKPYDDLLLIHDLRAPSDTGGAHLDHLVITRFLDVFIIESGLHCDALRITESREFVAGYLDGTRFLHRSLIKQLRRNSAWLRHRLAGTDSLKRLADIDPSKFHHLIVVPIEMRIEHAVRAVNVSFVQREQVAEMIIRSTKRSRLQSMFSGISAEKLQELGRTILRWHTPNKIDFLDKYRVAVTASAGLGLEGTGPSDANGVDTRVADRTTTSAFAPHPKPDEEIELRALPHDERWKNDTHGGLA